MAKRRIVSGIVGLVLVLALSGCFAPKAIEFGQRKVRAFPEKEESHVEAEKQAVARIVQEVREAEARARREGSTAAEPAGNAAQVGEALARSMGPPAKQYRGPATNLVGRLDGETSGYAENLADYRAYVAQDVGKKIEGTGWLKLGYFSYLALMAGLIILVWVGLKIWGMVNPVVGLGVNSAGRISSGVLKRAVAEISRGGEWFKEYLAESDLDDKVKAKVKDLFSRGQVESQSADVQTVVEKLTQ